MSLNIFGGSSSVGLLRFVLPQHFGCFQHTAMQDNSYLFINCAIQILAYRIKMVSHFTKH